MKKSLGNKKGMELSINLLVIVALAVFALFLIIGFVLGGFSYFKNIFGGLSATPGQVAQTKCEIALNGYLNKFQRGAPGAPSDVIASLCDDRYDIDLNGNGVSGLDNGVPKDPNDRYSCKQYVDTSGICS